MDPHWMDETADRPDRRRAVHIKGSLLARIRVAAAADERSISQYTERALRAHLDREGVPDPGGEVPQEESDEHN